MAYIDQILMQDEQIILRTGVHWVICLFPAALFVLSLFLASAGWSEIAFLTTAVGVLFGLRALIALSTTELTLTNIRIVVKEGFFRRNSMEIVLEHIEGGRVDQSLLGRVLNYGTLTITGTGNTSLPLPEVNNPVQFWQVIQNQKRETLPSRNINPH